MAVSDRLHDLRAGSEPARLAHRAFVSKATGIQLAKVAARCMAGAALARRTARAKCPQVVPPYFSVKEAVFPFNKFPGVDPILSPEMRSTGEVMGVGQDLRRGHSSRARSAPAHACRADGNVLITGQEQRQTAPSWSPRPAALGFESWSPPGHGGHCQPPAWPAGTPGQQGHRRPPHMVDMIKNNEISWSSTPSKSVTAIADPPHPHLGAAGQRVTTTPPSPAAEAAVEGMKHLQTTWV